MSTPSSSFGLSETQWHQAKAELRTAIIEAAERRQMTWYSQIAPRVTVTQVDPYSALMNRLLDEISREEHNATRLLLTSIVTRKDGDREPGKGFYDTARALGHHFSEPYIFWATQVQDVFTRYGRNR